MIHQVNDKAMGMYIFIGLTLFFLALLLMSEYIGRNFWRFAPKEHLKQGEKIHVYVNGKYDRHATITGVSDDSVSIYGAVALPVDYRGSFYAIGKDSVGAKLVYVKYRMSANHD